MAGADRSQKTSSLIISEFVGCSPSMSGAIRVNPWSIDQFADGIYSAIKMPISGRALFCCFILYKLMLQYHSEPHAADDISG